jgi:predicted DsbA family dithiol-disulfide isomerase
MMSLKTHVYFDFVDPGSYLLHQLLAQFDVPEEALTRVGMELALPPREMIDPAAPEWRSYCDVVDQLASDAGCTVPRINFVPWTRKAHELAIHAGQGGHGAVLFDSLFRAHFEDHRDLGRIDVLTELARDAGLDHSEARAVLDVDKYTEDVATRRSAALDDGIARVPTIRRGSESLVGPIGFHDLRTLFESPGGPTTGT